MINISSGSRTVENFGEGYGVEYTHYPLEDRIGMSVETAVSTFTEAAGLLQQWVSEGRAVLVHCSAGLSRSASMVMAWLILSHGVDLSHAVATFTAARGRQPACTPSYWTALMRLERLVLQAGAGTPPTFDYTEWICDDVGGKGEEGRSTSLQLETDAQVAKLLRENHDWDADAVFRSLMDG